MKGLGMKAVDLESEKVLVSARTLYLIGGALVGVTLWVAKIDYTQANNSQGLDEVRAGLIETDKDRIVQREKMMAVLSRIDNRAAATEAKVDMILNRVK
jgi:hypothetical protein